MSNSAWFVRWDFEKWYSHTTHLSPLAYGAYMKILTHAWLHSPDHCSVSSNMLALKQIIGLNENQFESVWTELMASPDVADITLLRKRANRWYNKGLQKEWKHIEATRKTKKAAAEARWSSNAGAMQLHSACIAKRERVQSKSPADNGGDTSPPKDKPLPLETPEEQGVRLKAEYLAEQAAKKGQSC